MLASALSAKPRRHVACWLPAGGQRDRDRHLDRAGRRLKREGQNAASLATVVPMAAALLAEQNDAESGAELLRLVPCAGVSRSQAGLVGEDNGLDPVAQPELAQDPRDVGLDGGLA